MKEQVWFKARVISSHGRHSFVEKEDGTVLEATRKGKKVDLAVGDIVELSADLGRAGLDSKNRTAPLPALPQRRAENQTSLPPILIRWQSFLPPALPTILISFGRPAGGGNRRHSHSDDSEQDGLYRRRAGSPTVH